MCVLFHVHHVISPHFPVPSFDWSDYPLYGHSWFCNLGGLGTEHRGRRGSFIKLNETNGRTSPSSTLKTNMALVLIISMCGFGTASTILDNFDQICDVLFYDLRTSVFLTISFVWTSLGKLISGSVMDWARKIFKQLVTFALHSPFMAQFTLPPYLLVLQLERFLTAYLLSS